MTIRHLVIAVAAFHGEIEVKYPVSEDFRRFAIVEPTGNALRFRFLAWLTSFIALLCNDGTNPAIQFL